MNLAFEFKMHSLEHIIDYPMDSAPSQILVLLADPFRDFEASNGAPLSSSQRSDLITALEIQFAHGRNLLAKLSDLVLALEPRKGGFTKCTGTNAFDMLEVILDGKPKELDKKMGKIYNANERAINKIKNKNYEAAKKGVTLDMSEKINGVDAGILLLLYFTHQWHHNITKRSGQNPFIAMEGVPRDYLAIWIRAFPGVDFPNYALGGWQERMKTAESMKAKFINKTFERWAKAKYKLNDFYAELLRDPYITDMAGLKIFGSGRTIMGKEPLLRKKVDEFIKKIGWESIKYIDYESPKNGEERKRGLHAKEYLIRPSKGVNMPGVSDSTVYVQLQVSNWDKYLLDDFFLRAHNIYSIKKQEKLDKFRLRNPEIYDRLEKSTREALSFLPK